LETRGKSDAAGTNLVNVKQYLAKIGAKGGKAKSETRPT
jgi:hypothetical protein